MPKLAANNSTMSVQRSPPGNLPRQLNLPASSTHYNSDSALDKSVIIQDDNYFNVTKRQKRTLEDGNSPSPSLLSTIKSMFTDLIEQQDSKFDIVNNTLLAISTQNKDIQKSLNVLTKNYEELQTEIQAIKQENTEFKQRLSALETKLELQEKQACSSMIEIRNIPKSSSASNKKEVISFVDTIGPAIGLEPPITPTEIRDIYQKNSGVIVVHLNTTYRKESFLNRVKLFNKNKRENGEPMLNTEHINLSGAPRPIYISECLTTKMKQIFYQAREHVRNKKLSATWTAHGRVFVKKDENSNPTRINDSDELLNLIL